MDASDSAYFDSLVGGSGGGSSFDLNEIREELIALFKEALEITVYSAYSPSVYERTYMLLNSVKVTEDLLTGDLYVFSDLNTGYYSAVTGEDVSKNLNGWIEYGHHDGGTGMYHDYNGRGFLEKAEELIKAKFPELKIEIVSDENY